MEHTVTSALPNDITNVYADGKLYVQDFFRLACINATTGVKIWDQWLGHNWHGGPVYANGKIYAASELETAYVLNANTGAKLDDYGWGDFCWTSPAIYDNMLYWGTLGMKVYCFEQGPYGELVQYSTPTPNPTTTPTPAPTPSLSSSPAQSATPQPTATPTQASTATPVATKTPTQTATPQPSEGISTETLLIAGAAVVIIVAVIAAALVLRKRR